jgi:hypothetical protein
MAAYASANFDQALTAAYEQARAEGQLPQ